MIFSRIFDEFFQYFLMIFSRIFDEVFQNFLMIFSRIFDIFYNKFKMNCGFFDEFFGELLFIFQF